MTEDVKKENINPEKEAETTVAEEVATEVEETEDVVKKEKEANLVRFKLKESQRTIAYLGQVNTEKILSLPLKIQNALSEFLEELEIKPLIVLIFGSYAKRKYTKESDIDILLVFQIFVLLVQRFLLIHFFLYR